MSNSKTFLVYLTVSQIKILLDLLYSNKEEGTYWGRKDYFIKNRNEMIKRLENKLKEV